MPYNLISSLLLQDLHSMSGLPYLLIWPKKKCLYFFIGKSGKNKTWVLGGFSFENPRLDAMCPFMFINITTYINVWGCVWVSIIESIKSLQIKHSHRTAFIGELWQKPPAARGSLRTASGLPSAQRCVCKGSNITLQLWWEMYSIIGRRCRKNWNPINNSVKSTIYLSSGRQRGLADHLSIQIYLIPSISNSKIRHTK